jgi:DUF1009 family protein
LKIGLLAGYGDLPLYVAKNLKKLGYEIVTIAFNEEITVDLSNYSSKVYTISVGQAGRVIKTLKKESVNKIIFAGKINKTLLFSNLRLDFYAVKLLMKLKDRKDDTIMLSIVEALANEGIEVVKQTEILGNLLIGPRVLSKKQPTKSELKDIEFGYKIAKEMGRLDIGQTVVVKDMAVMAVEAIEGTDAAIERGCELAKKNAVVVKVSKPNQDERFDVPTVGLDTLKNLYNNGGKVLAIEANKTLLVDMNKCIAYANDNSLVLISYGAENEN